MGKQLTSLTIKRDMKPSIFTNEQELLKAIIEIHCPEGIELDPMYFKGNFYKEIEAPKYAFDISPQKNDGRGLFLLGVKQADARNLPLENKSISTMILDPPFMFGIHGQTKNYYSSKTHGILKDFNELKELYQGILKEAHRILKTKGICVFKCQDFTDNKTTMIHCEVHNWAKEIGFYPKDLAILCLPKGKISNPNLAQRHFRKVHSYFWIFQKIGIIKEVKKEIKR